MIWGLITGALATLVRLFLSFRAGVAQRLGRKEVEAKDAQAEADARARMQDAAAKAPSTDEELVDRLRDHRF